LLLEQNRKSATSPHDMEARSSFRAVECVRPAHQRQLTTSCSLMQSRSIGLEYGCAIREVKCLFGVIMDVRHAPREVQEVASEKGIIPYIPADRDEVE